MTGKERILKAFSNNGQADRVPFTLGLDNVDLISLSGMDNWDYENQGHTMLSDLVYWSDKLNFDVCHYLGGIPEPNPSQNIEVETFELEQQEDAKITKTVISTACGKIWQMRRYPRVGPELTHVKYIKDIKKDWPVFREYFGYDWQVVEGRFYDDCAFVGDRGVVGVVIHTPIDFWQEYRDGGVEQVIYDFLDERKIIEEFCEYYLHNSLFYLASLGKLNPKPDFVLLHGSSCSASLISPRIFETYAMPFIKQTSELLAKTDIPSVLHICGKCNEWLNLITETDIKVMDALEHPPAGNVNLAEVKKKYGKHFCLKGNVSAIKMAIGSKEDVRREVQECIEAAAGDGGFLLDVGDSIGPKAELANLEEFVNAAREYGEY